ncbi:hypothetical protein FLK61_38600 [Paenalkalicoccus suaedae]|uniref:Uncharacterized protein n=1 Tax=Paenalkalicoccus suaedae TaxID=2592382 RepID=A0A859FGP0_9BACI|nr:hypothetical protein [Paenalkalicoccus suaedae]QKS72533.1 hypothetical protein FLK61_38600 [Paenalkalicoccus suaedae]
MATATLNSLKNSLYVFSIILIVGALALLILHPETSTSFAPALLILMSLTSTFCAHLIGRKLGYEFS